MKKVIYSAIATTALSTFIANEADAAQQFTTNQDMQLDEIANLFATTSDEIQALNQLNGTYIEKNATIAVPDQDIVIVKEGDSLQKISQTYNVSVQTLLEWNQLNDTTIYPGELLAVSEKGAQHINQLATPVTPNYETTYNEVSTSNVENVQVQANTYAQNQEVKNEAYVPVATNEVNYNGDYQVAAPTNAPSVSHVSYNQTQSYSQPASQTYTAPQSFSGSNLYNWGQCTYYAFERRQQLGKGVGSLWGNANNWASAARSNGYTVNNTPSVGAIFQSGNGAYGHVGVVEAINADGSIQVSEMNWNGVGVKSYRNVSNTGAYNYIH
ncbi:CHAP domain-containing protein [Staphylococcus massiliensis]|uniref:Uncharacterized protein n=1 Tax=Staphylococcus massiliensis S46 TaxID=1229783 RepID=K9AR48_9STAP|nr:CHAP domain-containing protein [Staphylococcus massiliensis]EKU48511.1 hypothetical protein C273_04850 [Staphylococcus massiliensis S46]MCG3400064.1 CHAP domain-containing protein [Staphylococcus massiliensis]MCG3401787.1 CHAP domain-containing protein [Staphylococcus massiliensis]MCG3412659.1 CHAP domain-containing protein [Staphylococcus massiliensis]POA01520.1 CHAP domain-containing protein [Staphylococcus massiliensis CCUG 55927]